MQAGIAEAALATPPLDVRGRRNGFNVVYRLNDSPAFRRFTVRYTPTPRR